MLWSLNSDREFNNICRNTPEAVGPGTYEIGLTIGNKKKMKAPFGTKQKRQLYDPPQQTPPPGEYEAKPLSGSLNIRSVFQSGSKRNIYDISDNPSPAEYSRIPQWGSHRKRSSSSRKSLRTSSRLTAYVGQDINGFSVDDQGNLKPIKKKRHGPEYVGPGSYDPEDYDHCLHISLNRSSDRELYHIKDDPGPSDYDPTYCTGRIPIAISSLPRGLKVAEAGPPSYENQLEWARPSRSSSAAFRSRSDRNAFSSNKDYVPSPTSYYHERKITYSRGNGFGFKADRDHSVMNNVPGPGAYEQNSMKWISKTSPSLSRAMRSPKPEINSVPGPGTYEQDIKSCSPQRPSSVFESLTQSPKPKKPTPGPSDYHPYKNPNSRKILPEIHQTRYEREGNWIEQSKIETPSPTQYQNLKFNTSGQGKTISPQIQVEEHNDNPGPGHYDVVHGSFLIPTHHAGVYNNQ